jgi:hypothetical protein
MQRLDPDFHLDHPLQNPPTFNPMRTKLIQSLKTLTLPQGIVMAALILSVGAIAAAIFATENRWHYFDILHVAPGKMDKKTGKTYLMLNMRWEEVKDAPAPAQPQPKPLVPTQLEFDEAIRSIEKINEREQKNRPSRP